MENELRKFLNGETDVFVGTLKLTRDKTNNGYQYLRCCEPYIVDANTNDELFSKWVKEGENKKSENPKHTGGKKPYLMLMINEVEELRDKGVNNVEELIGYVVCLGKYIEWNTGKLVQNKRNKKSLQYKDLLDIYKCSKPKLNKMIKLMKDNDLLYHTDEGYFISQKYIKKGKSEKNK